MIAYCGLDCSACDGYIATQSGNEEELKKVSEKWSKQFQADIKPEHVICDGCRTGERQSFYCTNLCKMRKCFNEKGYNSCIECTNFACKDLKFVLDDAPEARENLEKLKR